MNHVKSTDTPTHKYDSDCFSPKQLPPPGVQDVVQRARAASDSGKGCHNPFHLTGGVCMTVSPEPTLMDGHNNDEGPHSALEIEIAAVQRQVVCQP